MTRLAVTLLFSMLAARVATAQQPIAPVPLTPFGDGEDSVLTKDLAYQVLQTNFVIIVPAGFVTDFASTPRALWSVLPPTGRYQLAAVVHDFLYWDQGLFTRASGRHFPRRYEREQRQACRARCHVEGRPQLRAIRVECQRRREARG